MSGKKPEEMTLAQRISSSTAIKHLSESEFLGFIERGEAIPSYGTTGFYGVRCTQTNSHCREGRSSDGDPSAFTAVIPALFNNARINESLGTFGTPEEAGQAVCLKLQELLADPEGFCSTALPLLSHTAACQIVCDDRERISQAVAAQIASEDPLAPLDPPPGKKPRREVPEID